MTSGGPPPDSAEADGKATSPPLLLPAVPVGTATQATFESSGQGRRVFRNTLVNGVAGIASLAINFALVAYAIHRLGSDAYGVWVLALSFSVSAGYLSISDLGLQMGIVKFVADADGRGERLRIGEVVSSALAVLVALAGLAILALLGLAVGAEHLFHVPDQFHGPLRLLFVLLAGEAAFGLPGLAFVGLLEGLQRYGWIRAVDFSRQVLYAILVVIVLSTGRGVVAFGAAMTVSSIAAAAGYLLVARRLCPELRISPRLVHLAALRPLASFSAWVFLARINGVVWRQMDKVILAAVIASTLLTGYEVAARIQAATAFVLSFTASAVVPAAAGLAAQQSLTRLRDLLLRGTRYTLALSLPVTVAAIILARPLIIGWVGDDFSGMTGPTQLFLAYQLVVSSATMANVMLLGLGRVRAITMYATVAVIVNLIISVALVRPLGISGVIIGTLVGYGITAPLYIRLVLSELSMGIGEFLRGAIAPVLPWAALFALVLEATDLAAPPTHLVTVALCCVPATLVYAAGMARFAMSPAERRSLLGFLGSTGGRGAAG